MPRRNSLNRETQRLIYGLQMMNQFPESEREAIAKALGIDEQLAEMRAKRDREPTSYVYLLGTTTDEMDYYKIGKSVTPNTRLRMIRNGKAVNMPPGWEGQYIQPLALRLGNIAVENTIHRSLHDHRVPRTEWFRGSEITNQIEALGGWVAWQGQTPTPKFFETAQQYVANPLKASPM